MQSLNVVITKKVNLEELLNKFQEKLQQYGETEEIKKTRRFQKIFNSSSLLTLFERIIKSHQLKAEEREKERQ